LAPPPPPSPPPPLEAAYGGQFDGYFPTSRSYDDEYRETSRRSPPRTNGVAAVSSSSSSSSRGGGDDGSQGLRMGHWTHEEEVYADKVKQLFKLGQIPNCSEEVTLRALLSKLLNCTPMRVSKKYAKEKALGKCVYRHVGGANMDAFEAELKQCEKDFHRSLGGVRRLRFCIFETPKLTTLIDDARAQENVVLSAQVRYLDDQFGKAPSAAQNRGLHPVLQQHHQQHQQHPRPPATTGAAYVGPGGGSSYHSGGSSYGWTAGRAPAAGADPRGHYQQQQQQEAAYYAQQQQQQQQVPSPYYYSAPPPPPHFNDPRRVDPRQRTQPHHAGDAAMESYYRDHAAGDAAVGSYYQSYPVAAMPAQATPHNPHLAPPNPETSTLPPQRGGGYPGYDPYGHRYAAAAEPDYIYRQRLAHQQLQQHRGSIENAMPPSGAAYPN